MKGVILLVKVEMLSVLLANGVLNQLLHVKFGKKLNLNLILLINYNLSFHD